MKWEEMYCTNPDCIYYGVPFYQGLMVKNGSSHGQKKGLCKACGKTIYFNDGTAYFGLKTEATIFETAVRALAEGNSIRSTSRIFQVDRNTVCEWLDHAAQHCRLVMLDLWQEFHVTECQLDELWSFVHTKEKNLAHAKKWHKTYGDAWVWIAFAPVWRLVLAFVVGKRNQESANLLLQRVVHVIDKHIPFFTSDQLAEYKIALLNAYGEEYQPQRQGNRGCYPKPRRKPLPRLLYAQVVKERQKGRVVKVTNKIVFGNPAEIEKLIESSLVSKTVNTSFVERDNLTQRQNNQRLTRQTNGFSKDLNWFEKQLWLSLAYYHFVLHHSSLRQSLTEPIPTRGSGSPKRWIDITPAMAAGITDHVWTTRELLSYRIHKGLIKNYSDIEKLFPKL